ncbi:hypothetical protein BCR43DRAFT_485122 [Syncephalastrum racemosum]|uniref:SET domain-containing protein n=1 Tax=Syncephalastrum racemosum TaxID=13706 RepID=A0A1X2HM18_SYNRA|nr:hypothetical protein BCR43DRAFT_485122 [Syncephalastrum racemosum]
MLSYDTVLNQDTFEALAELRDCQVEGRSLVSKRAIKVGEVILVEKPVLQYDLLPTCRSSIAPHYTPALWQELTDLTEEDTLVPGVPAAMLAYLRHKDVFRADDFYAPTSLNHPTVHTIRAITAAAKEQLPAYKDVDLEDLRAFVLAIYANAHTVAYASSRTQTHIHRKARRQRADEPIDPRQPRQRICLQPWGSKFAHACAPNLFLQYETSQNAMVFRAARSIQANEVLAFSYLPEDAVSLGGLVCGSVTSRRAKLDQSKFFICACARCKKEEETQTDNDHQYKGLLALATAVRDNAVNEEKLGMMEPYCTDVLEQGDVPPAWARATAQSVLAAYHLDLFGQCFGKGLAARFGMTLSGLNEALAYLQFLDTHIWPANPMPAFFAAWPVLARVANAVEDGTQKTVYHTLPRNKPATKTIRQEDSGASDSDSDSDSDDEGPEVITTTERVPLPEDWKPPIQSMLVIQDRWIPHVRLVFHALPSPVVDAMLARIDWIKTRLD